MKAAVIIGTGGVKKLQYTTVPTPKPKTDETLIKVRYCGVNRLDLLVRQGKRPGPRKYPHVLGSEIVGETPGGEKVAVYPWLHCGACFQCSSGNENICDKGGTIGRTQWGGYAEYVAVPTSNLVKIPKGLPLDLVCASTLAATTAYHLVTRAKVEDRSTVLVTGASGGVGVVVIQLLKHRKCQVVCTTSGRKKRAKLKQLGVDKVVQTDKLAPAIKRVFPGGVEYVIDIMGGSVWSAAVAVLAKEGTMVFCATSLDQPGVLDIGSVFSRELNILGVYGGRIKDLVSVLALLKKKILRPVVDSVYLLSEAGKAHQRLENQQCFGKMLLKV